jgi:hypothetical protein
MPINWIPLKPTSGPSFSRQVDAVIQTYVESEVDGAARAVRYLRTAIQDKLDELEFFISTIEEDTRCVIFEKQSRRMRKLLQVRAEEYVNMLRGDGYLDIRAKLTPQEENDDRFDIRGSIHEADLGFPIAGRGQGEKGSPVGLGGDAGGAMGAPADSQFDLPLPAGVDLEAKADERTVLGNRRDGGLTAAQGSPKSKRNIYPWERGADTGEDIVGPPNERILPGGSFAVQIVLTKKEHQHYAARRRIRLMQLAYAQKNNGSGRQNLQYKNTIHKDFVAGKKKSAIDTYSALRAGPYVEPSYNAANTHRHFDKDKHIGEKAWTTHI